MRKIQLERNLFLVKESRIKNRELLKEFFLVFSHLKKDEKKLLSYDNLKIAFKEEYGKRDQFSLYERFLNEERLSFVENVNNGELIRESYIGKSASNFSLRELIVEGLGIVPFGSKRILGQFLYDLLQSLIGFGTFGELVTWEMINSVYGSKFETNRNLDHPTLQGQEVT